MKAARHGTVAGSRAAGDFESQHWLVPLDDRRQLPGAKRKLEVREGMVGGFTWKSYVLLVENTARLFRSGKARIHDGVDDVMERRGTSAECTQHADPRLFQSLLDFLSGNFFTKFSTLFFKIESISNQNEIL